MRVNPVHHARCEVWVLCDAPLPGLTRTSLPLPYVLVQIVSPVVIELCLAYIGLGQFPGFSFGGKVSPIPPLLPPETESPFIFFCGRTNGDLKRLLLLRH